MTSKRITKRAVDALTCPSGRDRVFLWDDDLSGFGVAAMPSGKKTYVAQFRQDGRSRRMKLGDHGRMTPDEARSAAKKVLGAVEGGSDPIAQRRAGKGGQNAASGRQRFSGAPCPRQTEIQDGRRISPHPGTAHLAGAGFAQHGGYRQGRPFPASCEPFRQSRRGKPGGGAFLRNLELGGEAGRSGRSGQSGPADRRYPEKGRERYLTVEELRRLGKALRDAETVGLPWLVDESGPKAKHLPKEKRSRVIDPYAVAAIRLLMLTGARLREILDARWDYIDWDRGLMFLPDSKTGRKTIYLSDAALALLTTCPA